MSGLTRFAIGLPALALIVSSLAGCDRTVQAEAKDSASPASTSATTAAAPGPPVSPPPANPARKVAASTGQKIGRTLVFESHLMVDRDVGVTTRRDGIIAAIIAERGQRVKEGEPLARLEDDDLVLSEKTAVLELEKEQSSYERSAKLHEQAIVPKEEFEQARLRRDSAQKTLERIRYELGKCVIKAPFDGVVTGRFVEKGQVLREDDRKVLFQVTALGPLLARVYVPEWARFVFRSDQGATVFPAAEGADGARGIEARVKWINDVVDAASGTTEVLLEVPPGPRAGPLRPGMSVQVRLDLSFGGGRTDPTLVTLPRDAVKGTGGADLTPGQKLDLKVVSPDGTVTSRPIVLGFVGDTLVEVRRGLAAGEMVVVD
ncbi:MAG TPA: efflux RND transporter periplasmic adaptor subunit [Candidatus Polarisedimenticolaceae bacterium]|nr:efflux RND transporter periplasmic adaptor subunit [Candidatus Polarisedimenticolaceae bacterium]